MIEERNHPIPQYRTEFEVSSLEAGKQNSGELLPIHQVKGGLNRAKASLYDYIAENSYRVAENGSKPNVLDITHLTTDNVVIRYVALLKDTPDRDVQDLRLQLTSFSTPVEGLAKKLQQMALDAVYKK